MARVAYGATSAADDDDDIRFGSMGYTTELSEDYVTTAQYMARDLDDPYAYEKKPIHYIPGYTGHLPLNRERFGVNYREASAATIAMQKSKGVHHPVTDLSAPAPNYVRATRTTCPPPAPHSSAELDGRREDGPCSREAMLPPPPLPSERCSLGCHDPTVRPTRGPHRPTAPLLTFVRVHASGSLARPPSRSSTGARSLLPPTRSLRRRPPPTSKSMGIRTLRRRSASSQSARRPERWTTRRPQAKCARTIKPTTPRASLRASPTAASLASRYDSCPLSPPLTDPILTSPPSQRHPPLSPPSRRPHPSLAPILTPTTPLPPSLHVYTHN